MIDRETRDTLRKLGLKLNELDQRVVALENLRVKDLESKMETLQKIGGTK